MPTKEQVEAAERAFREWQEMTHRHGNEDRFPFHAGYYARDVAIDTGEKREKRLQKQLKKAGLQQPDYMEF